MDPFVLNIVLNVMKFVKLAGISLHQQEPVDNEVGNNAHRNSSRDHQISNNITLVHMSPKMGVENHVDRKTRINHHQVLKATTKFAAGAKSRYRKKLENFPP